MHDVLLVKSGMHHSAGRAQAGAREAKVISQFCDFLVE